MATKTTKVKPSEVRIITLTDRAELIESTLAAIMAEGWTVTLTTVAPATLSMITVYGYATR